MYMMQPQTLLPTQVTQRESAGFETDETDLNHPSGERPARPAFPTLVEAVERAMTHDREVSHRVDTFTLKACIDTLQIELAKVDGCIVSLQRELALAAGTRADFERDRAEAERALLAKLLKVTADTMAAQKSTARVEGELAA